MTDTEDSTSVRRDAGEVLIVTGMSGAGRSTAADALEDLGWYVVDNLPPQMLRPLLELTELAGAPFLGSRSSSTCAGATCSSSCPRSRGRCATAGPCA